MSLIDRVRFLLRCRKGRLYQHERVIPYLARFLFTSVGSMEWNKSDEHAGLGQSSLQASNSLSTLPLALGILVFALFLVAFELSVGVPRLSLPFWSIQVHGSRIIILDLIRSGLGLVEYDCTGYRGCLSGPKTITSYQHQYIWQRSLVASLTSFSNPAQKLMCFPVPPISAWSSGFVLPSS